MDRRAETDAGLDHGRSTLPSRCRAARCGGVGLGPESARAQERAQGITTSHRSVSGIAEQALTAEASATRLKIFMDAVSATYQQRARGVLAHIPIVFVFAAIGWGRPWNLALLSLLVAYMCIGLIDLRLYRGHKDSLPAVRRHVRGMYVQLLVLGVIYNIIFVNLAFQGLPQAMTYLALITALFCAGGSVAYQHLRGLLLVFIVGAMTPQVVYHLLMLPQAGGVAISGILLVFTAFMAQTSLIAHRYAVERLELLRKFEAAKVDAEELARTDALTGLLNRRAVNELASALFEGAVRARSPLSVIILNVDHFKAINDSHGHPVGDAVIAAVAATMKKVKRAADIAGRIGGEEFILVLPHTRGDEAVTFAERLRKAIPGSAPRVEGRALNLTCSLGTAEVDAVDTSLMALVQRADAALYAAKKSGRNRTCSSAPSPSEPSPRPVSS